MLRKPKSSWSFAVAVGPLGIATQGILQVSGVAPTHLLGITNFAAGRRIADLLIMVALCSLFIFVSLFWT
jgi:hypothetical protein